VAQAAQDAQAAQMVQKTQQQVGIPPGISTAMEKQIEAFCTKFTQQWSKSKEEAFMALEVYNRQEYIAGLNRLAWITPLRRAFPDIDSNNLTYINAKKKVLRDYKNWKSDTLFNVYVLVDNYVQGHANEQVGEMMEFLPLRNQINKDFSRHWFLKIFSFAKKYIDLNRVSRRGYKWLRCPLTVLLMC
jgi:hypothetical protein